MPSFIEIRLSGNIPSKKNSKRRIKRGNATFMVPSLAHEEWHATQMALLQNARVEARKAGRIIPFIGVQKVRIEFTPGDGRRADLSNKAESVMDLLVDAGLLVDDNWWEVPELILTRGQLKRHQPGATIMVCMESPEKG